MASALARLDEGAFDAAMAPARLLVASAPRDPEALLLLGLAEGGAGRAGRAAHILARVAAARPDAAHPATDLAHLLLRHGGAGAVCAQYAACLRQSPGDARLRRDYAAFLRGQNQPAEAAALLEPLLATSPDDAAAQHLCGLAYADLGRNALAVACFRAAIAIDPAPAPGWANLGMMLKIDGRFAEAVAAYDQAVARAPADAQIRVNRAVALLAAGRLEEAWAEYEWRLRLGPRGAALPVARLLPTLGPATRLDGQRILVTHEEGFGDTLHFLRYVPMLAARGAAVTLWVPRPLARLLEGFSGVEAVISGDQAPPAYDFHCPVFSLPRVFASRAGALPAAPSYLRADPLLVAHWAARLPPSPPCGMRVGLVWAGQARPWLEGFATLDARRSLTLAALAPLAGVAGVAFISLQMGPSAAQAAAPPCGLALHDPSTGIADFADTAAILAQLDLLVSVDTAVVHLAGALGVPVWMLDRYDHCWRWAPALGGGGPDDAAGATAPQRSAWYPGLRIFRQPRMGEWDAPITQLAAALAARAGGSISSP
ncbi:MAG: tetratricopeptide repeat protein [Rhodospirillales bacterium]|nr:tetratricopeptide repeat protein [Rhodospirillales bacterium]